MDSKELALITTAKENPKDWLPLQVYADWLDDHTDKVCNGCVGSGHLYPESYRGYINPVCRMCNGATVVKNTNAKLAEYIRARCNVGNPANPQTLREIHRLFRELIGKGLYGMPGKTVKTNSNLSALPDSWTFNFNPFEVSFTLHRYATGPVYHHLVAYSDNPLLLTDLYGPLRSLIDPELSCVYFEQIYACIQRVYATDKTPGHEHLTNEWTWERERIEYEEMPDDWPPDETWLPDGEFLSGPNYLPKEIFGLMASPTETRIVYGSKQEANDALTRAVLTFIKNRHNLRQSDGFARTR